MEDTVRSKHLALVATVSACVSARAEKVGPWDLSEISRVPHIEDYTHLWWAEGLPSHRPKAPWLRCIQTGRYAMVLDTETLRIPHFGPVPPGLDYAACAAADNRAWQRLPSAALALTITVDGKTYRCTKGGRHSRHGGPRLIASGRFVQRADVTGLVFDAEDGSRLPVDARFETTAWPDRLALLLEARPRPDPIVAGPSFGRVGGGYGFDGDNDLDEPYAPELDPVQFTLAFWVFPPVNYRATRAYPWLICKGGSEWADGHFGVTLREGGRGANNQGVPRAFLNIGGGRENTHMVAATRLARYDLGLETEKWHHLAMTYDGQELKLYVDGEPAGSKIVGKTRRPAPGHIAFARRQDGSGDGYRFRGVLDEVRLYRRALKADDIKAQAAKPEQVAPDDDLVREWTFDAAGKALASRPSATWANATMAVQMKTGDLTFEETVQAQPDTPWTRERAGHVAVVVPCAPPGGKSQDLVQRRKESSRSAAPVESKIQVTATDAANEKSLPVVYEPDFGWHRIDLNGVVQQGKHNDKIERVRLRLVSSAVAERPVRLLFAKTRKLSITGISAMLRDVDGNPTGIPVQLSKNWHRARDLRLEHEGPWFHGFSLLHVPARTETELELTIAYAHWGGVAAASHAQLSLIGWGSNQLWDQSALGSWGENICYEPDRAQAQALITDVRPLMVHTMKSDRPRQWGWTNNVGGGDVFRLFDRAGERILPARMRTAYHRQGPCLTEVTYAGELAGGAVEHQTTVSLRRTDDITRGVYRLRMDVREPVEFSRFVVFQIGADTYSYTSEKKMALGNADGLVKEWRTQWGGETYRTAPMPCQGRAPWVSLHEAVPRDKSKAGAWANRGIVIREWKARLGGNDAIPWAAEYGVKARGKPTSTIDIVPPRGVARFLPGDYVEATFEHVIMPQFAKDYYGPNQNLRTALEKDGNTWRMIHREAVGNDVVAEVAVGALEGRWPAVRIRAVGDRAELAVTGGLGYVPITICGLRTCKGPRLEVREPGGDWQAVDQSVHGNDFWQTDYAAASATWEVTYNLPSDAPADQRRRREYRFVIGE